jgi:hypothetical protein
VGRGTVNEMLSSITPRLLIINIAIPVVTSPALLLWYCIHSGVPYNELMAEIGPNALVISVLIWLFIVVFSLIVCMPLILIISQILDKTSLTSILPEALDSRERKQIGLCILPGFVAGHIVFLSTIMIGGVNFELILSYVGSLALILMLT